MSITKYSIEKNRITIMLLVIIFLSGIVAYNTMPKAEDPGFIVRVANVLTFFPGGSPERVEQLVTDKIEKVIQEIPEVDFITSTSKTGVSSIMVNIKQSYTDMRPIWDKLRRKVEGITDLPEGVTPVVNDEFGDVFGIIIGMTGEGFSYTELKEIAEEVRDELLHLPDAAKVEIDGIQDEQIIIAYDNARLAELGMTTMELQQTLQTTNILFPGGNVKVGGERIILEPSGSFEDEMDISKTILRLPNGEMIFLEDVANIYRTYLDPPRQLVAINGQVGLALSVSLKEGGNIIDLGEAIDAKLAELQAMYPIGVDLEVVAYQDKIVDETVSGFVNNVLQSVAVVMLVMLLFLGVRTGLVIATLIPMTMVASLFIMTFFSIGLDQVSLAALIIALGMLVDNAIVMAESIMVRMERGEERMSAAVASAKELSIPLLISSLTTSAAFLPIFLAESNVGEFTSSLFKVITIALLSSWTFALTMIPMLCFLFLKIKQNKVDQEKTNRFKDTYGHILLYALRRPFTLVAGIAGLFILSLFGFRLIPVIFFPPSERNLVTAEFELPEGTAIERTQEVLNEINHYLESHLLVQEAGKAGVENWASWVGSAAPKYSLSYNPPTRSPNLGYMLINTTSGNDNRMVVDHLSDYCQHHFPELNARIDALSSGPSSKYAVEVRISGKDTEKLYEIVGEVKNQLRRISGTVNISDDWGGRTKKLRVEVDQTRASRARLTSQDIAISLQTALSGIETSEYREDNEAIPILMRNVAAERQDLNKLETINVYAQMTGKTVPLSQVADLMLEWQPAKILRRNHYRTMAATCNLDQTTTAAQVSQELQVWLDEVSKDWPRGFRYEIGGETEASAEANQSIMAKLPIAGLLIVLLLVGQFNSLRKASIVLLTIPLGVIGVVVGLLLTGSYFGFMTLLGIVSLAGIVINNAIVLLDRIQIELDEFKRTPQDAIVVAAQQRFRPIMLTTATTVLGLIPLWLGGGAMWEPMAIGIIFGLLFATVVTLLFVPVMYRLLFRVSYS